MKISIKDLDNFRKIRFEEKYENFEYFLRDQYRITTNIEITNFLRDFMSNKITNETIMSYINVEDPLLAITFLHIFVYEKDMNPNVGIDILLRLWRAHYEDHGISIFNLLRKIMLDINFQSVIKYFSKDMVLSLLIGEYARKCDIDVDFLNSIDENIPQIFLSYTHVDGMVLDNFEKSLNIALKKDLNTLKVVNICDKKICKIVSGFLDSDKRVQFYLKNCYLRSSIIKNIKYENLTSYTISCICKYFLARNKVKNLTLLLKLIDLKKFCDVLILLANDKDIWPLIKDICEERLENYMIPVELYFILSNYYDKYDFTSNVGHLPDGGFKRYFLKKSTDKNEKNAQNKVGKGYECYYSEFNGVFKQDYTNGFFFTEEDNDAKRISCFIESLRDRIYIKNTLSASSIIKQFNEQRYLRESDNLSFSSDEYDYKTNQQIFVDLNNLTKSLNGFGNIVEFDYFIRTVINVSIYDILSLPDQYINKFLHLSDSEECKVIRMFNRSIILNNKARDKIVSEIINSKYKELFFKYVGLKNIYVKTKVSMEDIYLYASDFFIARYLVDYIEDSDKILAFFDRERIFKIFERLFEINKKAFYKVINSGTYRDLGERIIAKHKEEEGIHIAKKANELLLSEELERVKREKKVHDTSDFYDQKFYVDSKNESITSQREEIVGDHYKPEIQDECNEISSVECNIIEAPTYDFMNVEKEINEAILDDQYNLNKLDDIQNFDRFGLLATLICEKRGSAKRLGEITACLIKNNDGISKLVNIIHNIIEDKDFFFEFISHFIKFSRFFIDFKIFQKDLDFYFKLKDKGSSLLMDLLAKSEANCLSSLVEKFENLYQDCIVKSLLVRTVFYQYSTAKSKFDLVGNEFLEYKILQIGGGIMVKSGNFSTFYFEEDLNLIYTLKEFLNSENTLQNILALKSFYILGDGNFDLKKFMNHRSDEVIEIALKFVKKEDVDKDTNEYLLNLLYRVGNLKGLGNTALGLVNIDILDKKEVDRIYDMFFIDPLNYLPILRKIIERGYELTSLMVGEIIHIIGRQTDEAVIKTIDDILSHSVLNCPTFEYALETLPLSSTLYAKRVLTKYISKSMIEMDDKIFNLLCVAIANESHLEILYRLITLSKEYKYTFYYIESWKKNSKLDQLMLRIYPIYLKDKDYYRKVFNKYEFVPEKKMILKIFGKDLEALDLKV